MSVIMLNVNPNRPDLSKIRLAAKAIKSGKLVVFPTETVYGIGANALDGKACMKIFRVKGRPQDNPLIVHVSSMEMAERIAEIPPKYRKQIMALWPGPLTLILKAKAGIPKEVTAGLPTVAVRFPSNLVALALIKAAGVPIAAPSANVSKRPSATEASHAASYFRKGVAYIIDSGISSFGIESTILDLSGFRILRPGAMTVEQISSAFMKRPILSPEATAKGVKGKPISPGMKYLHYSPEKPLLLFTGNRAELAKIFKRHGNDAAFIGSEESCMALGDLVKNKLVLGRRNDQRMAARNLFRYLIKLDSLDVNFGIAEAVPENGLGTAVMNRLRKASGNRECASAYEAERFIQKIKAPKMRHKAKSSH